MTDPFTLLLAFATATLLAAAAWAHVPELPEFDAERWFKLMFATTLRGAIEAGGGDAAKWEAAVARFLAYHPAGRLPERKIVNPNIDVILGKPVPGERALIEDLARLERSLRWKWMYEDDPVGAEARLADPDDLGPTYDPATWIAEGWDGLAAWGAGAKSAFPDAARRRLASVILLVAGDAPTVGEVALFTALEAEGAHRVEVGALAGAQQALAPGPADRLVIVASGRAPLGVVRVMADDLVLREKVMAVVAVGADFAGEEATDLLAHLLRPEELGTEVARTTPYISIGWFEPDVDPPGIPGRPIAVQRFPKPSGEGLEAVDLGVLPNHSDLPGAELARALIAFLACYLASRE
jgi:hypothetical protein